MSKNTVVFCLEIETRHATKHQKENQYKNIKHPRFNGYFDQAKSESRPISQYKWKIVDTWARKKVLKV
jgi:hypothetical protein